MWTYHSLRRQAATEGSKKAKLIATTLEMYLELRPSRDQGEWLELEQQIERTADFLINELRQA